MPVVDTFFSESILRRYQRMLDAFERGELGAGPRVNTDPSWSADVCEIRVTGDPAVSGRYPAKIVGYDALTDIRSDLSDCFAVDPNGNVLKAGYHPNCRFWGQFNYLPVFEVIPRLTVGESDGSPLYVGISQLEFVSGSGFSVTNPSTGVARVDIDAVTPGGSTTITGDITFLGDEVSFSNVDISIDITSTFISYAFLQINNYVQALYYLGGTAYLVAHGVINNLALPACEKLIIKVDDPAGLIVTGIANGVNGRPLRISVAEDSTGPLGLAHEDAGSVATNRLILPSLTGVILVNGEGCSLDYDTAAPASRWRYDDDVADPYFGDEATIHLDAPTSIFSLLNTTVTPGTYTYATLTVDAQGRIIAASSGAAPTTYTGTLPIVVGGAFISINNADATHAGAISATTQTIGGAKTIELDALGTAQTAGLTLTNTTAATSGNQQYSPAFDQTARGFASGGGGSKSVVWVQQCWAVQGSTEPTGLEVFGFNIDSGGFVRCGSLDSLGTWTSSTGVFAVTDGNNNTVTTVLTLSHNTTGMAGVGLGAAILFDLNDSAGTPQNVATDTVSLSDVGPTTYTSRRDMAMKDHTGTSRTVVSLGADGSKAEVSFFGAALVGQQSGDISVGLFNLGLWSGAGTFAIANLTGAGTGVLTALAINVGAAGSFVTNGGAMGTPLSVVLTNGTGLPISTGVSGLGTGVATMLGAFSSANIAAACTDETGTPGSLVFSVSPALTGNPTAPTQTAGNNTTRLATTAFVANAVATAVTGLLNFKGATDCSANPNYPSAVKGDSYLVSVAGKIGGASGTSVDVGDWYVATADNAGGTEASVGASWGHMEHNLVGALLASNNLSDLASASTARTNLGLGNVENTALSTWPGTANVVTVGTITTGVWNGTAIDATHGGTGVDSSAWAQGDIVYLSATGTWNHLAKNTTATRYLANTGTSNNPAWSQIDLTNGVTGTLPIGNGGTGLTGYALGDTIYCSAANVLSKLAGNTTSTKKFLRQTGTGSVSAAPAWDTIIPGDIALADGAIIIGGSSNIGSAKTMSGDVTITDLGVAAIGSGVVTLAKIANAGANSRIVGSNSGGSGAAYTELTAGGLLTIDATSAKVTAAVQADMETGTSTTTAVVPGVVKYDKGNCKTWVYFTLSGTTVTVQRSNNVSSVTRGGAGVFTINFSTSFSDTNYAPAGMAATPGTTAGSTQETNGGKATGSFGLTIVNPLTGAAFDATSVSWLAVGDF